MDSAFGPSEHEDRRGRLDAHPGLLSTRELAAHRWLRDQYRWVFREVREGRMQDPFNALPRSKKHLRAIVNVLHEDWKVRAAARAAEKSQIAGIFAKREHVARAWQRPMRY